MSYQRIIPHTKRIKYRIFSDNYHRFLLENRAFRSAIKTFMGKAILESYICTQYKKAHMM